MYFNELARKWDTDIRIERGKLLAKSIYKNIELKKDITALEIGCGTGLITMELREILKEIYCTDISKEMLKVLKEKIEKYKADNIHLINNEAVYKEEFYKYFDLIYSSMVFHHIEDIEKELCKIYKILKRNGILIIIDLDEDDGSFHKDEEEFRGHNGFNRETLKIILEKQRFKKIKFETVFRGEKKTKDKLIQYSLFLCIAKI